MDGYPPPPRALSCYLQTVRMTGRPPPGVKYLHEAAHGADLGVYFESNGHGTVLFSTKLRERLTAAVRISSEGTGRRRRGGAGAWVACGRGVVWDVAQGCGAGSKPAGTHPRAWLLMKLVSGVHDQLYSLKLNLAAPLALPSSLQAGSHPAAAELLLLSRLINQTVGDAISGLLLVELILRCVGLILGGGGMGRPEGVTCVVIWGSSGTVCPWRGRWPEGLRGYFGHGLGACQSVTGAPVCACTSSGD